MPIAGFSLRVDSREKIPVASDTCIDASQPDELKVASATSLTAALIPVKERWIDETQRRLAIRNTNEQLEQSSAGLGAGGVDEFVFICECGDRACTSLLRLSLAEYESVRAHPAQFAIARNHENPEAERVVKENGRFAIVETVTGEHSKPALESNPRWQRGEPW